MDWLAFVASVIGSLAWPVTLLVGFFLIKGHISELFPFIERLKYKDFEIEFRKTVHELAERSRAALPVPEVEEGPQVATDRLYSLAEISPRSAVLEAWLQVETAAAEALQAKQPTLTSKVSGIAPLRLGEYLNRHEIINRAQLEIFHRLRELRNKAVHVGDAVFRPEEVGEYIALATSLASQIRRGTYGP